jgi:hypothetical protein
MGCFFLLPFFADFHHQPHPELEFGTNSAPFCHRITHQTWGLSPKHTETIISSISLDKFRICIADCQFRPLEEADIPANQYFIIQLPDS